MRSLNLHGQLQARTFGEHCYRAALLSASEGDELQSSDIKLRACCNWPAHHNGKQVISSVRICETS